MLVLNFSSLTYHLLQIKLVPYNVPYRYNIMTLSSPDIVEQLHVPENRTICCLDLMLYYYVLDNK